MRAMSRMPCLGPDPGQKPDVDFILYLDNIRIFTEDLGQGYVDTVKWPEPKSVGITVPFEHQTDCRTTYLQFKD